MAHMIWINLCLWIIDYDVRAVRKYGKHQNKKFIIWLFVTGWSVEHVLRGMLRLMSHLNFKIFEYFFRNLKKLALILNMKQGKRHFLLTLEITIEKFVTGKSVFILWFFLWKYKAGKLLECRKTYSN